LNEEAWFASWQAENEGSHRFETLEKAARAFCSNREARRNQEQQEGPVTILLWDNL
jgi:hypothetical protein